MELVNSIPQYAAIIKHCPDVIRAILSIQADAFDCDVLYRTLSTTQCSTCERFGDHLYLITCRRVCYFCFTRRMEYCPLTIGRALRFFHSDSTRRGGAMNSRQPLNFPTVLSLPGRYCTAWTGEGGNLRRTRLQLIDRRAVIQGTAESGLTTPDKTTREPRRFMAIITAPYLFNYGRQVDWGYFCLGCKEEKEEETKHFRIKYTKEEMLEHIASEINPEVNDGRPVLIKLAVWPWEIPSIEMETTAYQWISDTGIGPRFLGHLTEGKYGRVVVTKWLEGARAAGPGDMDGCKKALGRLHKLGIKLGDINKHNFLVRDGHDVVLVDFEVAKRECSSRKLEDEMRALKSSLEDTSYRGGVEPIHD